VVAKSKSRIAIDLADYDGKRGGAVARYDLHALYVISCAGGAPRKIGIARDPARRLRTLQTGHPDKLTIEYLLWTPGSGIASRIERAVHKAFKLAGAHRSGEWFNVTAYAASETVRRGAEKLFPAVEFYDHAEMVALLDTDGFGRRPATNYTDEERNLLVRAFISDPASTVLPKLGIHVWAELFRPMTRARLERVAA
jgi:hypothetical protein